MTTKIILEHVSVQTTQIYTEMSQDSVDRKLKEWNDTWFGIKLRLPLTNYEYGLLKSQRS